MDGIDLVHKVGRVDRVDRVDKVDEGADGGGKAMRVVVAVEGTMSRLMAIVKS